MIRPRVAAIGLLVLASLAAPDFLPAPPNPVSSLSLSPTSVLGGGSSTGTVTLTSNAPTGGALVGLASSNTTAATVPANVTVPAGLKTATFAVTTSAVGASTSVTITASYSGGSRTATLTVTPAVLTSVSVSPGSVSAGTSSTGTVSLNGLAHAAGANVALSSSNPSVASVPGSVTVPSSSSSATFPISTFNVASSTNVTITAVYSGTTKTATLTVTPGPPALSALTVNPATVVATGLANGTATLNQPAPAGGAVVALSSSDASVASVPSSITIPAGSTSGGFSVTTYSVPADTSVTISGSYGGVGKTAALSVIATFSLTLDDGSGPIYTKLSAVGVKGHVMPGSVGPSVLVRGTLGAQNVTATPASNGAFTLPNLTLAVGSNAISVTGTSGSQSVGPVQATYVYDNVAPSASVGVTDNVPNPTNIATWTLSGWVVPYQGATENAFVYLNGGSTRFPIAADGTWSGSFTFVEGRNSIPFAVADLAGNSGSATTRHFYLDTLGLRPIVVVGDYVPGGSLNFGWPAMLDVTFNRYLGFVTDSGASLNGSHLDVYFDEQGSFPGGSTVNCAPDNLTCLVERKPTPDISVDFPTSTQFTTPLWPVGIHTIRMVLRDPFGNVYERGALLPMAEHSSGSSYTYLPLANFGVPGTVTTQTPKLVGRMVDGVAPLDCNDKPGNRLPSFSYWDPKQGGSWKSLTASSSVVSGGVYEATPTSNIPITTLASGEKVLRIKLTEGVVKTNLYGNKYLEDTFGRNICDGQTVLTSVMKPVILYTYPYAGSDAGVFYDLPYRSAAQGDNPVPQIDTSAAGSEIATDTSGPYSLTTRLRVTDLNGDLDYRNVTVATAGCGDSSCTFSTRLAGDQLLTSAQPGGYFTVQLPLVVGANNFVATARDDAGHVTNQSFTVTRSLTEVEAKITSPTTTGNYAFCSPKTVTFDASQSINRTSPPTTLRHQWTVPPTNSLASTQPTYTETLQSSGSRRVIVSSMAISAPPYQASDPCAGIAGKCSVATVNFAPFTVSNVPLPAQILAPLNDASVPADQPVTLDGTVGQNADPSYVYKWRLQAPNGDFLTIPQSTGTGSDPSYAVENRTLTLRLDSISGVVAGGYTLFFHAAHLTNPGSCIERETFSSIGITVTTKVYTVTGIAPGTTLPGATSTRLYGSGFDATAQIAISGPVYSLTDTTTPLCTMPACPQVTTPATVGGDGTTLDFTTPANLTPGIYLVFASDPATGAASSALWFEVQPAQGAAPAKTQEFSNLVHPLVSGQTLSGQFLADRDPSGKYSDVDYYYFFATAGSAASLSLSRTDASLPWEAPDSLDPELHVADPDGVIWQGFESLDNQTGVDLNASITNLVLPKTGRYTVYTATSKGFGPYQLTYSLAPVAPAAAEQVIPATNNDRTVRLNVNFTPTALTFDKRGYPLAGAIAQFTASPEPNETGQVSFANGGSVASSTRGFAQINATLLGAGKISFESELQDAGLVVLQDALTTQAAETLPHYRPVATATLQPGHIAALTGMISGAPGPIERLEIMPPEMPAVAVDQREEIRNRPGARSASRRPAEAAAPVLDARRPIGSLSVEAITSCSPRRFHAAGVSQDVDGPFTVTLTDLTPKTGETTGEEVIGVDGINGHRVDKTIRIKIEIKDGSGVEPNYPVLVRLWLAGTTPGTLILDPDGARIPCQSASFLWHEIDSQTGQVIPNSEFEYRLGTTSGFAGVKPDPQAPGEFLPVWGTTEVLSVFFGTFDEMGNLTNQYSAKHGVHPEPAKPHHFEWNPTLSSPAHERQYLAAYAGGFPSETSTFTNGSTYINLYYLVDQHGNRTFGHRTTSETDPASNVNMTLLAQAPDWETESPIGYKLRIEWNDNPSGVLPKTSSQWPDGPYVTTLTISGTDVEDGPFSISQAFTAVFSQPLFYDLYPVTGYDQPLDLSYDDSTGTPISLERVGPGAAKTRLNGDLVRNSILLVRGTRLSFVALDPLAWPHDPPYDPEFVKDGLDSFDISLVDEEGEPRTDAEIQIAFCPKFNEGILGPCPVGNRTSSGGVILGVRPIDRGYMGLMVSKAPTAPGHYFFKIKPLPSNVHPWRTSGVIDPVYNNYKDFYALTVRGGEFLDENFERFPDGVVRISQPTTVYFRYLNTSGPPPSGAILSSRRSDGTVFADGVSLGLNPISTREHLGVFAAIPEGYTGPVPQDRPSIFLPFAEGSIKAASAGASPQGLHAKATASTAADASVLAEAPEVIASNLRIRFLKRESTCQDESCLTDGDPPGEAQETWIQSTPNHPEAVRVLVDVVNPVDGSQVQNTAGDLSFEEVRNPDYQDSEPLNRQLFYDGRYGSTDIGTDGKIDDQRVRLTGGRAAITLYSVAEAKYSASGLHPLITALPYTARIRAKRGPQGWGRSSPTDSPEFNISQWVNERGYQRTRENPNPEPSRWTEGSNDSPDWLEAQTLDYCIDASAAAGSEADRVYKQLRSVRLNWDIPEDVQAQVDPTRSVSTIEWRPSHADHRYGVPGLTGLGYLGLQAEYDGTVKFGTLVDHEARHCWQLQLASTEAVTDGDGDGLPASPNPLTSSPELTDAAYNQGNPEFDFKGDSGENSADTGAHRLAARERNAVRFQGSRGAVVSCEDITPFGSVGYTPGADAEGTVTGALYSHYMGAGGTTSTKPLKGALIKFEMAPAGTPCDSTGPWTFVCYSSMDNQGVVSATESFSGVVRMSLVPPPECSATVVPPTCVPVP